MEQIGVLIKKRIAKLESEKITVEEFEYCYHHEERQEI